MCSLTIAMFELPVGWLHGSFLRSLYKISEAESIGLSFDHLGEALEGIAGNNLAAIATESERIAFFKTLHIKDLALAHACYRRLPAAWDRFLALYEARILIFARAITRNESQARELSESFLGDLFGGTKFASYSGRGPLDAWLRAVLTHTYLDSRRFRRRFVSLETHPGFLRAISGSQCAEIEAPDSRVAMALEEVLSECEAKDRFLLAAYFFDGRTLAEIARALNVHESTASRRLDRLLAGIRRAVKTNLRKRGMSERQIKESLQADVRSFSLDLFGRLLQDANPTRE